MRYISLVLATLLLIGCGGGSSKIDKAKEKVQSLIDENIGSQSNDMSGQTETTKATQPSTTDDQNSTTPTDEQNGSNMRQSDTTKSDTDNTHSDNDTSSQSSTDEPASGNNNNHTADTNKTDDQKSSTNDNQSSENNSSSESSTNNSIDNQHSDTNTTIKKIVDRHNYYRNLLYHDSNLTWDDEIAKSAQEWANYLAEHYTVQARDRGYSPHDNQNFDYGENIAWGIPSMDFVTDEPIEDIDTPSDTIPDGAVDAWASEKAYYDYETNSQKAGYEDKVIGHYTQLVWKESTKVGCAKAKSQTDLGGEWVVCRYYKPGNMTINGVKQKPY